MSTGISSATSPSVHSGIPSNTRVVRSSNSLFSCTFRQLKPTKSSYGRGAVKLILPRIGSRCNCSSMPGGPAPEICENTKTLRVQFDLKDLLQDLTHPQVARQKFRGENESKRVLDAFFLGKALAETLSERIESTVGEFLSTVGRLQAEQQKQVQEFQDEVLERAKRAKERAAREAMEAQGLVTKPSAPDFVSTARTSTDASITVSSAIDEPPASPGSSSEDQGLQSPTNSDTGPLLGISIDD